MKIGIVGCGLNSDYHIRFAKEYLGLQIIGLIDKDEQKAKECATKNGDIPFFPGIKELVQYQKPDVIHIVTPPQTHFSLAKEALESGCHVLLEKPMTLNTEEARKLFDIARTHQVMLCPIHNHFFDPCMLKARTLIQEGKAGRIVNVESYYGLNTRIDAFRKYPKPNVLPWLYSLPGGVFQDFMAHPLYVMLPYIGKPRAIQVMEKSFKELPQGLSDELRILLDGDKAFGVLTISFAAKPYHHFVRIYGTKMMIQVNFDTMTTTFHPISHLPKAAQKATYNLTESRQLFFSTLSNVWNFGRGKLRPYQGMKTLIHQFYDAVKENKAAPISEEDAVMVIETMDKILHQVKNKHLNLDNIIPSAKKEVNQKFPKVLVTGAAGFLGARVVEMLVQKGYPVRALIRKLSHIENLKKAGIEIYFGDVGDFDSLRIAFKDVDLVVHAAADTSGNEDASRISTIQGTSNVIDLCRIYKIKKLIYISSCSVYGVPDFKKGELVQETSALERYPEKRGNYTLSKLQAELIVREAIEKERLPAVILRPGMIFGPGGELFTPMLGFAFGQKAFFIIGNGRFILPLVFVDNVADAIIKAIEKEESIGKTFNVVDRDPLTKKEYIELLIKKLYPKARIYYIPYSLLYLMIFFQEIILKSLKRTPFLTCYRLTASQKKIVYDSTRIKNDLNWMPPVSVKDAIARMIRHEQEQSK